jgi:hypothetical protein
MTAITQYYSLSFIPAIAANKQKIAEMILNFWETELKPRITQLDTYTIDFAVSSSTDPNSIRVIELNHPPPTAGTALFDWANEEDRRIISCGPFEIRVLDRLAENPLALLDEKLRVWMAELAPIAIRDTIRQMVKESEQQQTPSQPQLPAVTASMSEDPEKDSSSFCIIS